MVLGQSAATAAAHAIDQEVHVQQIDLAKLSERLLADGQVLQWTGPRPAPAPQGRPTSDFPGIVIDDEQAKRLGFESMSYSAGPFVGSHYRHDGNAHAGLSAGTLEGNQSIQFSFRVPQTGRHEVRMAYSSHANRATNVPVQIAHADGTSAVIVNQRRPAKIEKLFEPLGTFLFRANTDYVIEVSNQNTDGYVIADAFQIVMP